MNKTLQTQIPDRRWRAGLFIPFFLLVVSSAIQSQQVITGRIVDAGDGQPVTGANIFVANTTVGTVSDISGDYRFVVPTAGSVEIIVSSLGYNSFFYKIETPAPHHQLDVSLEIFELPEVVVKSRRTHRQADVNLFWRTILGESPSRRGLQLLNPEAVYFYYSNNVLKAFCDKPIEIVNHGMGYRIRYVLLFFEHDYKTGESLFYGMPSFEELAPQTDMQQIRWDRKRQEAYAVSITRFMRALYRKNLLEEGFLLISSKEADRLERSNFNRFKQTTFTVPLTDILQNDQVIIDSPLYLACFSIPVTEKLIEQSYYLMFDSHEKFPVAMLPPQQFTVYPNGTYSGILRLSMLRNPITGLAAMTPLEYGLDTAETTAEELRTWEE